MAYLQQITPFLRVPDIEEAIAFFRDTLGFNVSFRAGEYAFVRRDNAAFRMIEDARLPPRGEGRYTVYVDVDDVDALYAELKSRLDRLPPDSVSPPTDQEYGQRDLTVVGPDGDIIAFGSPMVRSDSMERLRQPVPELPVADVERAQRHYRDALGFTIGWLEPDKTIGAASREETVIFFRRRASPFEPVVQWVYCENLDARHDELKRRGADIVDAPATKPWGLRQFTVKDLDGNLFHFHDGSNRSA